MASLALPYVVAHPVQSLGDPVGDLGPLAYQVQSIAKGGLSTDAGKLGKCLYRFFQQFRRKIHTTKISNAFV